MIGQLFGRRFLIHEYLGRGGFGSVWRVHDQNQDRQCALKLFFPSVTVFQAMHEAQLLTALGGPYILPVYNADVYMDVPYISTAVAPLRSAEDAMGPHGVSWQEARRWVADALVGLDVCHRRGLIHRDVKPSNLFLMTRDRAQLGDFGVAAQLDPAGFAGAHGDRRIRAPEMYTQNLGDARADIWSAGVTLYTLLTGVYPFNGSIPELAAAIQSGQCVPLGDAAPHVPAQVRRIVGRAMSVNPTDRYATQKKWGKQLHG